MLNLNDILFFKKKKKKTGLTHYLFQSTKIYIYKFAMLRFKQFLCEIIKIYL